MGMFDTLNVGCTCGSTVRFQSKAGPCDLNDYTLDDVPDPIAADCIGQSAKKKTRQCGGFISRIVTKWPVLYAVPAMPSYSISGGNRPY